MGRGDEATSVRVRREAARDPVAIGIDREVGAVAAVLIAVSEEAAAHQLGVSDPTDKHHLANARSRVGAETIEQLAWIVAPRRAG